MGVCWRRQNDNVWEFNVTAVTLNEQETFVLRLKLNVLSGSWTHWSAGLKGDGRRSKQSTVIILDSLFSHFAFTFSLLSICLCCPQIISFNTAALWGATLSFNRGQWSDAALARGKSCLHMKSDSHLGILLKPLRHAPFKWNHRELLWERER